MQSSLELPKPEEYESKETFQDQGRVSIEGTTRLRKQCLG
jgi:hypothetical protein